jgi:hypothetical protein
MLRIIKTMGAQPKLSQADLTGFFLDALNLLCLRPPAGDIHSWIYSRSGAAHCLQTKVILIVTGAVTVLLPFRYTASTWE